MKSLFEIQQDVRALAHQIQDLSHAVTGIESDLDDMRSAAQDTDIDYQAIRRLAKQIPFPEHPLSRLSDERTRLLYLKLLFSIANLDAGTDSAVNRLVFLQWLLLKACPDCELAELYRDSLRMEPELYGEFAEALPPDYRDYFFVDAFVTAGIAGCPNGEIIEYLADLGSVLAIEPERLQALSLTARLVLTQSIDALSAEDIRHCQRMLSAFTHYLDPALIKKASHAPRDLVIALPDSAVSDFRWTVKNYQTVQKGDLIASCLKKKKSEAPGNSPLSLFQTSFVREEIKASSSGRLFQFRDSSVTYGVISFETDNKDSIKEWVKTLRNTKADRRI